MAICDVTFAVSRRPLGCTEKALTCSGESFPGLQMVLTREPGDLEREKSLKGVCICIVIGLVALS